MRLFQELRRKYHERKLALAINQKWKEDSLLLPLDNDHWELYEIIHRLCWRELGELPDLVNCRDFNDRIQWLKLFDQDRVLVRCSDKILVRDYVRERVGERYLLTLYQVHDHFAQIDFSLLPNSFVIKTNHDSGTVVLVPDQNRFEPTEMEGKIDKALSKPYGWLKGEWAYSYIKPKILIEEYIEPETEAPPPDYKFHCVDGKVRWLQYIYDRGNSTKEQIVDVSGEGLDIYFDENFQQGEGFKKPDTWDKMMATAEKLSEPFKYVRVDMYSVGGSVFVGEMTFFPMSGCYHGDGQKKIGRFLDFDRMSFRPPIYKNIKK